MTDASARGTSSPRVSEPLLRIAKRSDMPWYWACLIRVCAVLLALALSGFLTFLLVRRNPLDMYRSMILGSFGTPRKIWKLAKGTAVLLCISLAVTPAFRMRFWNIGAEGQVLVGCLATTACMFYLGGRIPEWFLILLMLLAGVAAGALWGFIPSICKALWNTNETLFTLMMNYIATYLVGYYLLEWAADGSSTLGRLPHGHLPSLGHDYLLIIVVAAVLTAFMYVYLNLSKHGYEIAVVGESEKTARYIGISVKRVTMRTMLLSGAICGLTGFLIVGGLDHTVWENSVGGQGFTAIMVSWLAKFNPLFMVLTSLLLIFLNQGAAQVSQEFNICDAFPHIVTGIILFFIIGCEFFIRYRIVLRLNRREERS